MSELEKLKKRIKDKFKSINRFCRCSGEDSYQLQILFSCEKANPGKSEERTSKLLELSDLVKATDPNNDDTKITPELRSKLHATIAELGGANKFCEDHPKFSNVTVFQILSGYRKNKTKIVYDLIKILGI
jgi:hypothetical protein